MVSSQLLPVLLLFIMKNAASINSTDGPIAKTQFGPVKGIYADEAAIFFGLPFGMPPVGQMRWKPPQPFHTSWAPSTYDATFPRPGCYQYDSFHLPDLEEKHGCPRDNKFSEDCLHLNIFTPLPFNPSEKLPVAIWLPGKRYVYGSATNLFLEGRFLANKTRSVIVTTNYRLGALGFLVAGEGEGAATGNYGTLDQIAAMQWVQSNIEGFGGDKDQVTIMGQSSGADSVALHLMAENTEHLFKQAIMMSIPFISHKTLSEALQLSKVVTELLNCTTGNMTCLRAVKPLDIMAAQKKTIPAVPYHLIEEYVEWGPYVDGNIVKTSNLQDMFLQGKFQKKPFILGTTTDEGFLLVYESWFPRNITKSQYEQIIQTLFRGKAQLVLKEYPPAMSGSENPILSRTATDFIYACPARRVIRSATHFDLSDVWLYHFDQITESKGVNLWGSDFECYNRACHGSDVPYLFQTLKLAGLNVTDEEQSTADSMAYYFGNFLHTGDPNNSGWRVSSQHQAHPQQSGDVINWPKYNKLNNYVNMKFTAPTNQLEQGYLAEKCDFWDKMK
ncbi:crystal protein-like [Branchiostoma floridae]|uniref:Carboxylic ester hydrolase n=1 Tax=Branchiostoma floridae TaxID=7739 RepID=A0A9J7MST0_BRAFL|nr:crystal protein-like [Branchiostoma floridae]